MIFQVFHDAYEPCTAGSGILLAGKVRLRAVFLFRTCTLSDTGRVLTQLFNNWFLCTRPCYLKGSSTSSCNGRTCSRRGTAGRHIGPILSLHYQNLHFVLFWRVYQYLIVEITLSSLGGDF